MKRLVLAVLSSLTVAAPASAQLQAGELTVGEVRKVDKDAKKVTIKHAPLLNLDMPAMTMVFRAEDPTLLEKVKAGDRVLFRAEKVDGAFAVKHIESAP